MNLTAVLIFLATIVLLVLGYMGISFLFMLVVNVILGYYDFKLLDFPTSLAAFALFSWPALLLANSNSSDK